ncbi:MAG TPA: NADPH:quinone reductase [Vicinamibacterales bacterium]|nr:NADPH:quinone reductase [Vicinamibacterales bacterium]
MKAIRVHEFGGPEVMRLEETSDPVPDAGDVLVRIRAAGVNPVDTYIRAGVYARKPALPYTPGSDAAGLVEAVGPGVTGLAVGQRVYAIGTAAEAHGTYAMLAVCRATQVFPLPDRVSYAQGAALGVPCATAYRALFERGRAEPGETVLIHGASGGVGTAAVQLAAARGLRVIGTAGSDRGLQLVHAQGAHHVLNHRAPGYLDEIIALTDGAGVDLIVEMAAHLNLDHDLNLLARHGRVVVVGNRGRIEIDPRRTMGKDAAILGMTLFNATAADLRRIHAALGASLANGTLTPVVGQELPLADAAKAHAAVMEPGAYGKIVLIP